MKKLRCYCICLALATAGMTSPAQSQWESPKDFFAAMAKWAESEPNYDSIKSDYPELVDQAAVYFGRQQDAPAGAVRLDAWSKGEGVNSGFPVEFNPLSHKLELARTTLSKTSEGMQAFAWYFCKAYNQLPGRLSQTGGPLALGAAAVVASDVLYPTADAELPPELIEPAAMVQVLLLEKPELLHALFDSKGDVVDKLVGEAYGALIAVPGSEPGAQGNSGVQNLDWLISGSAENNQITFADFIGIHPKAAEALAAKAAGIKNLRLRAYILDGTYRAEFGSPSVVHDQTPKWEGLMTDLMEAAKADIAARGGASSLAPVLDAANPNNIIVADPNLVATLFGIATELEAASDTNKWTRENLDAMNEEGLLQLLQQSKYTAQVIALAGSVPSIPPIKRESEPGNRTNVLCEVVFGPLARGYPAEWKDSPEKLAQIGRERVTCIWWRPEPVGEGKPFVAVHADTLLTVVESNNARKKVKARDVKPGDKILGYTGLPSPSNTNSFSLGPKLTETALTVVKIIPHHLRQPVALVLSPAQSKAGVVLLTSSTHVVNLAPGVSTNAAWRQTSQIEPQSRTWAGHIAATVNAVFSRELSQGRSEDFVEIALAGQKRKEANNFAVSLGESKDEVAVVEASPITSSSIPPDERIELAGAQEGQTMAVGEVTADPALQGKITGTTPAGYYVLPDDYPWQQVPKLSRFTTWILAKNGLPQQKAYKLHFEDDTVLTLGELSWVLTQDGGKLNETCVSPITLKPGSRVVTGVKDSTITTAALKDMEEISFKQRPVYVLLSTANLGYVKVGPALVATEEVPLDEFVGGVIVKSKLALLEGGTDAKQAMLAARSGKPRAILDETQLADPDSLSGKIVASFDPRQSTNSFVDTVLSSAGVDTTSRNLLLQATDPKTGKPIFLQTGPAQALLVHRGITWDYLFTGLLQSNDAVYYARSGETAPVLVTVQCVTPQFHLPDVLVCEMVRKLENVYENAMLPTGPVAFDEGIAIDLKVPGVHRPQKPRSFLEAADTGYGGSGATISPNRVGKAENQQNMNLITTREKVGNVVDIIDLPQSVVDQLQQRGGSILQSFAEETGNLKAMPEGHKVFWNNNLKANLTNSLRQIKAENAAFANTNSTLDKMMAMAAESLPYEEANSDGLERWMSMLMNRREKFIRNSSTARFSEVVFLETVMGSWLHDMGFTNTANQLQNEVVELSLLAACDPDRSKVRTRIANLKMLLLIQAPTFVSGMNPESLKELFIDKPAQDALKSWGSRENVEIVSTNDGSVSLEAVQAQLTAYSGKSMAPYIAGIPNISANGDLNEKLWKVDWDADFQQNGQDLTAWLHDMSLDIAFGYSDSFEGGVTRGKRQSRQ
jgi:hypothetical protein